MPTSDELLREVSSDEASKDDEDLDSIHKEHDHGSLDGIQMTG